MDADLENIDNQDFSEAIPPSEGSVIGFLLKQLRPGMSLSRITLPTFILETRSTIQRLTDWMAHADILRKVADEEDPYIRMLHLCTWIVSGFHVSPRLPKKPYNSLLGEVFRCTLHNPDGSIGGTYEAEQVSHHPPVSAFYYQDRKGGSVIWGHTEMRSKFYGNSAAALMDHENTKVTFECTKLGESYDFNLPDMYCRGILIGTLVIEMCGQVRVTCPKTGVTAIIYFDEKPMLRGKYNCVHGSIFEANPENPKKPKTIIKIDGRWSAYLRATDTRNNKVWLPFDVRKAVPLVITAPPLEEQCPYESEYAWQNVTRYLNEKNTDFATDHKLALEEKQRAERKYFEDNNLEWKLQRFHYDKDLQRYVPNALNTKPYSPDEEPQKMPEPFHIPDLIQQATDAGVVPTMAEVHKKAQEIVDEKIAKNK